MDVEARIGPAGCGMKAAAFATTAAAVMARLMVVFFGNSECRFFHLCGVTCRAENDDEQDDEQDLSRT